MENLSKRLETRISVLKDVETIQVWEEVGDRLKMTLRKKIKRVEERRGDIKEGARYYECRHIHKDSTVVKTSMK